MDPRDIAFERISVEFRLAANGVQAHSETLYERVVRMISRQGKYLLGWECVFAPSILHNHFLLAKLSDVRLEEGLDLPRVDTVLDVRAHPILNRRAKVLLSMDDGNSRSVAVQVERRIGSRIFSSDHDNILFPVFVWLRIVVRNVRQVFSGDAQQIGQIIVAGGHGNLLRRILPFYTVFALRHDSEIPIVPVHTANGLE